MSVRSPVGAVPESGGFTLGAGTFRARAREATNSSRAGMLALAGLLACGLLISIAAAGTDNLLPESVRPIPSWLAGPFASTGVDLGVGGLLLVLIAMFFAYVLAVHTAERVSGRAVLMTIAGLHALILLAPPLLSTDVFSYQIYGRMGALYSTNPYLHGPHAIALDQLYPYIGAKWVSTPSAYGPLFTGLSYLLAPLSIAASALTYKAIAAIASLATVALIWNAARLRGVNPARAAALFGLNPLVVLYGVGGAHNDLLMLALLVGGVLAALQHRERAGGGLIVAAGAIKLTAGLVLPFALARDFVDRGRRRRLDLLAGAGIAAAALGALAFALFGTGPLQLPITLNTIQNEGDWHSIPGLISALGSQTAAHIVGLALGGIFLVVFCMLIRRVMRGELDWINAAGWATVALLLTTSSLLPWYVAWLLPFVGLATDRRLWKLAIVMTGVILTMQMLDYIPHATTLL